MESGPKFEPPAYRPTALLVLLSAAHLAVFALMAVWLRKVIRGFGLGAITNRNLLGNSMLEIGGMLGSSRLGDSTLWTSGRFGNDGFGSGAGFRPADRSGNRYAVGSARDGSANRPASRDAETAGNTGAVPAGSTAETRARARAANTAGDAGFGGGILGCFAGLGPRLSGGVGHREGAQV